MAIVFEEERNRVSPLTLIGWLVMVAVILFAVYYIFFRSPEFVVEDIPSQFLNTEQISKIVTLDAETIANHPGFRDRNEYVIRPVPQNLGRSNPFAPF